jgi:methionyl-tRNA formyltransferase
MPQAVGESRIRLVVLAGAGSQSARRLVAAVTSAGLPASVCWYSPAAPEQATPSNYSRAWYPPATPADPTTLASKPAGVPVTTAATWDEATTTIRAADADLVVLVGMPIVPEPTLDAARLGVLNAHNGQLPSCRGMDAVGWAVLHNQPVVCSLHLARPAVDAGEVVATHPVPVAPTGTLAARVKTAQLRLLLAGTVHTARTGDLPDATPQTSAGTQYYRLHPHLKRVLDSSPYAREDRTRRAVSQP